MSPVLGRNSILSFFTASCDECTSAKLKCAVALLQFIYDYINIQSSLQRSKSEKVKVKVKSLSRVQLFVTSWTVAYNAPLSMGFSRQEK